MLNLSDSDGVFTPSESHPSNLTQFQSDIDAVERELTIRRQADDAAHAAEMQRLQREDDGRCHGCSEPTEGTTIAGLHVPICPACLTEFIDGYQRPLVAPKSITARCRIPLVALP